jgi:hypothetical protein
MNYYLNGKIPVSLGNVKRLIQTSSALNTIMLKKFRFDSYDTATIKGPLANQIRLIYPINQSDAY